MLFPAWQKSPDADVWLRSTIINHGPIIGRPGPGVAEFVDRRWSAVRFEGTTAYLEIISMAYRSGWDSDDPTQPFKTYMLGEYVRTYPDSVFSIDNFSIDLWDGSVKGLQTLIDTV